MEHDRICDGVFDCVDNVDEANCTEYSLYPYGEQQGDMDILTLEGNPVFSLCKKLNLNGNIGSLFGTKRYYHMHVSILVLSFYKLFQLKILIILTHSINCKVCSNGLVTMNYEMRLDLPLMFGYYSFYNQIGMISPFWGLVDEVSLKVFGEGQAESAVYYQVGDSSSCL